MITLNTTSIPKKTEKGKTLEEGWAFASASSYSGPIA